jgi:hypothetical protein
LKQRKPSANDRSRKQSPVGATQTGAAQPAGGATARVLAKPAVWVTASVVAAVIGVGIALQFRDNPFWRNPFAESDTSAATFVGSETCAGCHQAEAKLWRSSQHKHAMDHATDKSVLGDFSDVTFDHYGVRSRFFRKDGKYLVETDGPDGKLATFEIKYTFGLDPLQQYLIEFPDGRL